MAKQGSLSKPLSYDDLPGWAVDDHAQALRAFYKSAAVMAKRAPKGQALGVDGGALADIANWLLHMDEGILDNEARIFFETYFVPRKVHSNDPPKPEDRGFVTGYYEPEVAGSLVKTDRFSAPLLRRPSDLLKVADLFDTDIPADWDPEMRFGRWVDGKLVPYHNRQTISEGVLQDQGLELVYLDPVDAFFIHIQGSARIRLNDDHVMRVSYAAKSGHDYTAIGRILIDRNEIARADMSMEAIRTWLYDHPDQQNEVMWHNHSYIFFDELTGLAPDDGPIGAGKVSLTKGRSMAVDRLLHTYGTPIFVDADLPGEFKHLMIAQDTGSAIVGPARGDLYFGSGDEAEKVAGAIQHAADFYLLWPKHQAIGE